MVLNCKLKLVLQISDYQQFGRAPYGVATLRGSPSAPCFAPLRALQAAHAETVLQWYRHYMSCYRRYVQYI